MKQLSDHIYKRGSGSLITKSENYTIGGRDVTHKQGRCALCAALKTNVGPAHAVSTWTTANFGEPRIILASKFEPGAESAHCGAWLSCLRLTCNRTRPSQIAIEIRSSSRKIVTQL